MTHTAAPRGFFDDVHDGAPVCCPRSIPLPPSNVCSSRPQPPPIILPLWPTQILPTSILLPPLPTLILLLRLRVVVRFHSYQARVHFLLTFHHASSHFNPTLFNLQIPSNTHWANLSYLFIRPVMFKLPQRRCVSLQLFCDNYA